MQRTAVLSQETEPLLNVHYLINLLINFFLAFFNVFRFWFFFLILMFFMFVQIPSIQVVIFSNKLRIFLNKERKLSYIQETASRWTGPKIQMTSAVRPNPEMTGHYSRWADSPHSSKNRVEWVWLTHHTLIHPPCHSQLGAGVQLHWENWLPSSTRTHGRTRTGCY